MAFCNKKRKIKGVMLFESLLIPMFCLLLALGGLFIYKKIQQEYRSLEKEAIEAQDRVSKSKKLEIELKKINEEMVSQREEIEIANEKINRLQKSINGESTELQTKIKIF